MHIAFLTPEFPHEKLSHSGGLGTSIYNLATGLVKIGHKVSIFVYGQQHNHIFKVNDIEIHAIKKYTFRVFGWYLYRRVIANYINKTIAVKHIDVLEAPDWTGITAFMKINCPLIIKIHGSDTYFCHLEKRKQKKKNFWFESLALKKATAITSVSAYAARLTKQLFAINQTITVLHNGINLPMLDDLTTMDVEKKRLLYFGTLIRKKGVIELAHIFNEIVKKDPEVTLHLVGADVQDYKTQESTYKLFYERLEGHARKNITYHGKVSHSEIKKHIQEATVIVLPSLAEALPMTWLEAMAYSKPLAASHIGWSNEIVENNVTGFSKDPYKHKEYANYILKLVHNPELAKRLSTNARALVEEKFALDKIVQQHEVFYSKISAEQQ